MVLKSKFGIFGKHSLLPKNRVNLIYRWCNRVSSKLENLKYKAVKIEPMTQEAQVQVKGGLHSGGQCPVKFKHFKVLSTQY